MRGATGYDGEPAHDHTPDGSTTAKRLFANTSALVASRLIVAVLGWGGTSRGRRPRHPRIRGGSIVWFTVEAISLSAGAAGRVAT